MEFRHVLGVRYAQSVLSHVVDMRGPGVDEGHILTRVHHMSTGVSTDRASSDNGYLVAHGTSYACFSFLCKVARELTQGSAERNQFCRRGTKSRRWRKIPTLTM